MKYSRTILFASLLLCGLLSSLAEEPARTHDFHSLSLPAIGTHQLQILSPTLLELTLVTTKQPDPAPLQEWNFVTTNFIFRPPKLSEFVVTSNEKKIAVTNIGFKRRPLYAPLKTRDLRIGNWIYLQLATPISDGDKVEVKNPGGQLWKNERRFTAVADPLRWSPVIHVNQEGYSPALPKKAMIGFYLGSLGEMEIPGNDFKVIETASGKTAFSGKLKARPDHGYEPPTYQRVLEADFSDLKTPGEYRLQIPGLGASLSFFINDGIPADFARAYALGIYHQRCGTANELPFSRFTHGACHTNTAEVPSMKFETVNAVLAQETENYSGNPRHTAPPLKNVSASLYPFVRKGKIDVGGGHHDAGDYSKYTINCAQMIHALVFAADNFPGAGTLDNLGLPESGDGKSDLLQEAKWEADFLAKMQDDDGGFYFLVYPRDRQYEHDVLPDKGDPQVVFPKTTSATAAATAALAQISSSPLFRKQFPESAALYFSKAMRGWRFLERAFKKYGRDGSYQKITHYGDEFMHDDEIAWAATELFLATGDVTFQKELIDHFDPANQETRRWTWWRLFESYGCAIRSYALAAKSGRIVREKLDEKFLRLCEDEIVAGAEDQLRYSEQNAYGTSFPIESKRFRNAGWYFSSDRAFDLAAACALDFPELNDPRPKFIDALVANANYEAGCNPINVSFISGLGWKQPHEMVHHVAQNDRRILPPTGLCWGNVQEGFPWLENYQKELGALCFPSDGDEKSPSPFYDRWGDSFNTSQEFVIGNLARSLGTFTFLMGQTALTNQSWKNISAKIEGLSGKISAGKKIKARLTAPIDFQQCRVVWEMEEAEPLLVSNSAEFEFIPRKAGKQWLEAEAHAPDGRRVSAAITFIVEK